MFERFNATELCTREASLWALHAAGKDSGCVVRLRSTECLHRRSHAPCSLSLHAGCCVPQVDFGEHECRVVPIYRSHVQPHAVTRVPVGASQLVEFLRQLLKKSGQPCTVRCTRRVAVWHLAVRCMTPAHCTTGVRCMTPGRLYDTCALYDKCALYDTCALYGRCALYDRRASRSRSARRCSA
jgi:hypothetical protein